MRALVIDADAKAKIATTVEYANNNKFSRPLMLQRMKTGMAPGDIEGFICELHVGFKCVFTIEEHPQGWSRHLSVSVDGDKYPHAEAIKMLMKEFGIEKPLEDCFVYEEEEYRAVNIISKI